jgi:hypothetical protein
MLIQVLFNNIKVLGIYGVVSLLSIIIMNPLWLMVEYKGNPVLTYGIVILTSGLSTLLFLLGGRFFLKGTGVLFHDLLSFSAIVVIAIVALLFLPQVAHFFMYPHLLLGYLIAAKANSYYICVIVAFCISLAALLIGAITKSGITRII